MRRKMCIGVHLKFQLFLSNFIESWVFSTEFLKVLKHEISWKSDEERSSFSLQTDGQKK